MSVVPSVPMPLLTVPSYTGSTPHGANPTVSTRSIAANSTKISGNVCPVQSMKVLLTGEQFS